MYVSFKTTYKYKKWAKYCIIVYFNDLKNLSFLTLSLKLLVYTNFAIFDPPFQPFDDLTILLPHTYVNSI